MKKKQQTNFTIEYMDVDPYTGHIDDKGVTCSTTTEEEAKSIIAALLDYNCNSKHGIPNRQYVIKKVSRERDADEDDHWWTW